MIELSLSKPHKPIALWMMTLVITMTPWLSFWTSPLLSNNSNGETVIVCTVNGFKSITLTPQFTADDVSDACAALQLADALSSSPLPSANKANLAPYPHTLNTPHFTYAYEVPHYSLYSSRAPPLLS